MNEDNVNVCDKCGGRLALVVGTFIYTHDDEPYKSGVIEKSVLISVISAATYKDFL